MDAVLVINGKKEYITQAVNIDRALTDDKIIIKSKRGSLNYSIEVSQYLPKPIKHTAIGNSSEMLAVTRDYVDSNGDAIALESITQGMLLYSKVSIRSLGRLDNIAIVDRIPACFEIINERTNGMRRSNKTHNSSNFKPDYQDYRDDRVLTFISLSAPSWHNKNTVTFLTPVRAVSRGECCLPVLVAEAMYDPRINDYDKEVESIHVRKTGAVKADMLEKFRDRLKYKW